MDGVSCTYAGTKAITFYIAAAEVGTESLLGGDRVAEPAILDRAATELVEPLGSIRQAVALLATLMLRGPQTVGELRINSDRLHRFADGSAVEGFLHELAGRNAGALVAELPRQSGARENRWVHLLSGVPSIATASSVGPQSTVASVVESTELAALKQSVRRLQDELEALKRQVATLRQESGGNG